MSNYKRVVLEQYGEYVQMDGLTNRITYYSDLDYHNPITIEETYQNREDCLTTVFKDLQTDIVTEYFKLGREGACKSKFWTWSRDGTGKCTSSLPRTKMALVI